MGRIESLESDLCSQETWWTPVVALQVTGGKPGTIQWKRRRPQGGIENDCLTLKTEINSRWIKGLNVKSKTTYFRRLYRKDYLYDSAWHRISSTYSSRNFLSVNSNSILPFVQVKNLDSNLNSSLSHPPNPFIGLFCRPCFTQIPRILLHQATFTITAPGYHIAWWRPPELCNALALLPRPSHHHLSHLDFCGHLLTIFPVSVPVLPHLFSTQQLEQSFNLSQTMPSSCVKTLPGLPTSLRELAWPSPPSLFLVWFLSLPSAQPQEPHQPGTSSAEAKLDEWKWRVGTGEAHRQQCPNSQCLSISGV